VDPAGSDRTSFVAVVGPDTAWPGASTRSKSDIRDGANRTLMAVETADADIPWMKPEDLAFDRMSFRVNDGTARGPGSRLGGARALLASGHVFELSDNFPPATLRAMLTIEGGEPVDATLNPSEAKLIDAPPASGSPN
jgi:hypothetical protein